MANDPVPEADRLEQQMPQERDVPGPQGKTVLHRRPIEAPEADVYEQDLPVAGRVESPGIDAERSEPVADDDWAEDR